MNLTEPPPVSRVNRMKKLVLVLTLALLAGGAAYADSLTLTAAPYGVDGPYTFTLATASGSSTQQMVCFSDANTIYLGETWAVTAFSLANVGSITGVFAGTQLQYDELGWLADDLFAHPGNADIQDTIWAILGLGGSNAAADPALIAAANAAIAKGYQTTDLFYIPKVSLTATTNSDSIPQPFILHGVPEPSSLLLLAVGVLAMIAFSWRRIVA